MRTIQAKPLTADAFRQYGTFWSAVDGKDMDWAEDFLHFIRTGLQCHQRKG